MRSRIFTTAIAVGLGTARLVETIKEATPGTPPAEQKSGLASVIAAAAGAVLADGGWKDRTLAAAGAMGIAMLTHEARSLMSLFGDSQKVHVIRAATRTS